MAYYTAFASCSGVIYFIRKQGFTSLPQMIHVKYGKLSTFSFLLAVSYRLFNEVWSNSIVVASFYGTYGTGGWWAAVIVSTAIPMGYVFAGGMKTSLYTDVSQAIAAIVLFLIVMGAVGTANAGKPPLIDFNPNNGTNMWTLEAGFDLVIVGFLQGMFSYPFFDPVLTDRAFLTSKEIMLPSFLFGGTIAGLFIFFFGFLGIYGATVGVGGAPDQVAKALGPQYFSIMSLIMITSSLSTVDSTFTSTSKAWGLEAFHFLVSGDPKTWKTASKQDVWNGRLAIVIMAIIGTLPLIGSQTVLNATTISGTVVMGLGPPIFGSLFFGSESKYCNYQVPLAFHFSFWVGVMFGVLLQVGYIPTGFSIGNGQFNTLLGFNLYGLLICLGCYIAGILLHMFVLPKSYSTIAGKYKDDQVESEESNPKRTDEKPDGNTLPEPVSENSNTLQAV